MSVPKKFREQLKQKHLSQELSTRLEESRDKGAANYLQRFEVKQPASLKGLSKEEKRERGSEPGKR